MRVADNALQDNADWEEEGFMPARRKREGGGHAGSSRFVGVMWDKCKKKWKVQCQGKHMGSHTTEEAASRACGKYLEDGIDPVERREANTSQFVGVSWDKDTDLWRAKYKRKHLGRYATEEDAARACSKYLKDGIDPVKHRDATNTSQFTGVYWDKSANKWKAKCKKRYLGLHTTERAAVQAYNVEAERLGIALNVIPPTGAAGAGAGPVLGAGPGASGGAGPKRAAPKTPAMPATNKKTKRAAPTASAKPARSTKMKF
jgi:hypothetical protein